MIFHSDFQDSFQGIVHTIHKTKDREEYVDFNFRTRWLIDLKDYFVHEVLPWKEYNEVRGDVLTSYAYGIQINTFHSKLFILDYDDADRLIVEKTAITFMSKGEVVAVDIIKSSDHNYHLIIGFNDFFNVRNLYKIPFYTACNGFLKLASSLDEVTLRVSDKKKRIHDHFSTARYTVPQYEMCIRRIDGDWYSFTNDNIVYPYTSKEASTKKKSKLKGKLDLRRKSGHNSSEPKSQRTKAAAVNSLKDIEALSAANGERRKKPNDGDYWF